jgi:hypothetical protein
MSGERLAACAHLDAALAAYTDLGRPLAVGAALFYRGKFAPEPAGDQALHDLLESVRILHRLRSFHVLDSLQALAALALGRDQPQLAAKLLGYVVARREEADQPLGVQAYRDDLAASIAGSKRRLGPESFLAAFESGRSATVDELDADVAEIVPV